MGTLARMTSQEPDEFLVRLVREHGAALLKHLGTVLRSLSDAEDVAQETYAKLHRLGRPKTLLDPRAWLFTAAIRMAATHLKRERRRSMEPLDTEAEQVPDIAPLPEAHGMAQDAMRHLEAILRELPPQQRAVYVRYRILGESRKEIAAQLGIVLNTFDQHLCKAEARCRQRLAARGLGPQGGETS